MLRQLLFTALFRGETPDEVELRSDNGSFLNIPKRI